MSIGTYGTIRPSDVTVDNIEVFYNYSPDRETESLSINKIPDASEVIQEISTQNGDGLLEGLYNLRLPAEIFSELGIYTIYIKPKTLSAIEIIDCSVLSALPSVKGIVLDANDLPEELQANNAIQGYRIEYLDTAGLKIRNVVRHVVTSNLASPVSENIGNTSQQATRYRFDDNGSLMFLQLTPSSSSDVKPNVLPYIGNPGDFILLSNTYFSPVVIEVELVENTIDSIANVIAGEQIKDVDNGLLTYYDRNRNITKQFNLYEIKDDVTDVSLFEVKERRENIDGTQNFDDVTDEIN